ncbi:hypothetical protein L596_026857 [Steinernema carpocapsae]|uniref:7TM GPCR serpentine receptor class x (Srx) domain-containing protein n=1 Tax=Steinernema carpocapsae TaxID=34508 RepID=A0A4U5M3J0_STECR|nr:hypothetical protein L596_026857 [Steinernema carpocapsae]
MSTYLILHYTSAFINLIINIFTLYVIFTRTPSNMKNVAATILNIILWNFAGNIVWGLMPFHPLFPMNCYVLQGPLAQWLYAHDFEKYGFIFIVLFFLNACVGVQLSFQFRWIQLAAPDKLKHLGRKWAYIYSAGTHIWASVLFFYLSNSMFLTPETYPDFYPAFQNVPMFCMTPDKTKFIVLVCIIVVSVFLASGVIITLVLLSYKSLYSRRYLMSISTLSCFGSGKGKARTYMWYTY